MKISHSNFTRRGRQNGSAVFVFISLLAIMMILVAANSDALSHLHQETKLLEHRQIERLNTSQTNTNAIVGSPAKTESK
ncbi:MAG: hypothetical protein ABSA45_00185 [Verrucomicrobiota bacterium]|jgi:hypothetical protein